MSIRKYFLSIALFALSLLSACTDPGSQIDSLREQLEKLSPGGTTIEENTGALGKLIEAVQTADALQSFAPITQDGKVIGFKAVFKEAGELNVYNQSSTLGVGLENGKYYWMASGDWLLDASGNKVEIRPESVLPTFRTEGGILSVSTDSGKSWQQLGDTDKCLIASVVEDASQVVFTLSGGAVITIAKQQPFTVAINGDNASISAGESLTFSYSISGLDAAVSISMLCPDGWTYSVNEESASKGTITLTAPASVSEGQLIALFGNGKGQLVCAQLRTNIIPDGDEPGPGPGPGPDPEPDPEPIIVPAQKTIEVGPQGGIVEVSVLANVDFELSGSAKWFNYLGTKAVTRRILLFDVQENTSSPRAQTIKLTAGNYSTSFVLRQNSYLPLELSVPVTDNWIYNNRPQIRISVVNPNQYGLNASATLTVSNDRGQEVTSSTVSSLIAAGASDNITVSTTSDLEPGFYRAECHVNGKSAAQSFVFGIDPDKIVSPADAQSDFDSFWKAAKDQLAGIDMNPRLTEIPSRSTAAQKVYLVEIESVPDGPGGEPVTVRGYYLEPQGSKKYPVIVHYIGYDAGSNLALGCPSGSSAPGYAEFYLGTRGQYINCRPASKRADGIQRDFTNTYGDWFAYHFGDKDSYYYRGAYMDCIQAIRFMATRTSSDMDHLYLEGMSQGGAFAYAAAALSDYEPKAISAGCPFMSDFPDYLYTAQWPANVAWANQGSMSVEQMLVFLSYFDTKNLAHKISCPVISFCCLQDYTTPPHTNWAPYNLVSSSVKEMHYYPTDIHSAPADWTGKWMNFFNQHK